MNKNSISNNSANCVSFQFEQSNEIMNEFFVEIQSAKARDDGVCYRVNENVPWYSLKYADCRHSVSCYASLQYGRQECTCVENLATCYLPSVTCQDDDFQDHHRSDGSTDRLSKARKNEKRVSLFLSRSTSSFYPSFILLVFLPRILITASPSITPSNKHRLCAEQWLYLLSCFSPFSFWCTLRRFRDGPCFRQPFLVHQSRTCRHLVREIVYLLQWESEARKFDGRNEKR